MCPKIVSMNKKNYYLNSERASDYDRFRPSFHGEALAAYHKSKPQNIYDLVLDVGTGTGKSAIALADWSAKVEAIDSSEAMLAKAKLHQSVHYQKASAEELPFNDSTFDLIFVASSLHWFERRKFLNQASRVLKPQGKILIYDAFITNGLKPDFHNQFNLRFPRPYSDTPLVEMELEFFNLKMSDIYRFDFESEFTPQDAMEFVFYLTNVEAAIEKGESKLDIRNDIKNLIESQSTGLPYKFQVQLTEILKKQTIF